MSHWVKNVIFSLIPALALFLALETALRAVDFKYSDTPLEIRSFFDDPHAVVNAAIRWNNRDGVIRFVKDPKQLWVPAHSFEEHYSVAKKPGTFRIATLGCSCTATCVGGGDPETYPAQMEAIFRDAGPGKIEVLNAGVGSYSSFQGIQRLKHVVLKYRPDLITVFFGWNDHWIATVPDSQVRLKSAFETSLINFLEHFRTYQGLHYLIAKLKSTQHPGRTAEDKTLQEKMRSVTVRVPVQEYEKNLNALIDMAQANQARIVLITAPSDLSGFEPFSNFPFQKEALIPIHNRYNETVRKVARERGAALFDLDELVAREPAGSVLSKDGIHFSVPGCRFVAEKLVERLKELNLVS